MGGRAFFEHLADALVGFLPPDRRRFSSRSGARNLKLWYTDEREHYEAQLISAHALRAAKRSARGPVLEIGFHAEHRDAARNDEVLRPLLDAERRWRKVLGREPETGPFVGHQRAWRRISELWEGPDVVEPETAIEAAERLATYITALEPLRGHGGR